MIYAGITLCYSDKLMAIFDSTIIIDVLYSACVFRAMKMNNGSRKLGVIYEETRPDQKLNVLLRFVYIFRRGHVKK